ncbi:hypothetical protein K492DRAFT_205293 [Lichtheimia hyalospora FSU 10163]|nr:hypothetical protein K492DRAFT_205293 [Lichtheimia hyalospora FSU 10163]
MDITAPQFRNRFIHTRYQALRKCCGCIHLRVGAGISCLIWMGLSMYFAILSFQNKSRNAPLIVYGVVNLLLALNGFFGMLALFRNRWFYVRLFSHATWTVLFMVLVDGFANAIYFITQRDQFMSWCINSAADTLNNAANVTGTSLRGNDYYNCDRLFQAEIKFGLFSTVLMIVLYVYWGACIYSFSHKQGASAVTGQRLAAEMGMMPPPGTAGVPPPPMHPIGGGGPGRSNIIVLNNEKPQSKKFSFKSLRRNHAIDVSNDTSHHGKQLKRKSVPDIIFDDFNIPTHHHQQRRRSTDI